VGLSDIPPLISKQTLDIFISYANADNNEDRMDELVMQI